MNAKEYVLRTYNKEELKEIANHGCQSGVCRQHIYYGDTIQFFETFETDIIEHLKDAYGDEFLVDLFKESLLGGDLAIYKNNVCWTFIESVAMEAAESDDLAPAKMLDEWNNSFELYESSPA